MGRLACAPGFSGVNLVVCMADHQAFIDAQPAHNLVRAGAPGLGARGRRLSLPRLENARKCRYVYCFLHNGFPQENVGFKVNVSNICVSVGC